MSAAVAVVAADFNKAVVDPMVETARAQIAAAGARLVNLVRVPGAYEIPLVADALLARGDVDVVVALGFIERGETLHGEVMGHVVHAALVDLQLKYKKPVGIGIIGPGATPEQAEVRKIGAARAAVVAALHSLETLAALR